MNTTKTTAATRRRISNELASTPATNGCLRTLSKGMVLNVICDILRKSGYTLDTVTGDILLGDKGNRILPVITDDENTSTVDNMAISFTWEKLDENGSMEYIAYVA